jgi:AraC-like DNA-binding protein
MDQISAVLRNFDIAAHVFYSGTLCRAEKFDSDAAVAYLHVLRAGNLLIRAPGMPDCRLQEPTAIFFPRPLKHRFLVSPSRGADLVCATVNYGLGVGNPLLDGLPPVLCIPLAGTNDLLPATSLLFEEAFQSRLGRQIALDRIFEYLFLLILRHSMQNGLLQAGVLLALGDRKLAKAMACMHTAPGSAWTLEHLAQKAGMSRARFAAHFHRIVGTTPLDYLTKWRISMAMKMLNRGDSPKAVASAVGYSSSAVLSRLFVQRVGITPRRWKAQSDQ